MPTKETFPESLKNEATPEETSPREPGSNLPLKQHEITTKAKPEQKTSNITEEQETKTTTKKRLRTLRRLIFRLFIKDGMTLTDVFDIALRNTRILKQTVFPL